MSGQRAPSPLDLQSIERELDAEEYLLLNPSSLSSHRQRLLVPPEVSLLVPRRSRWILGGGVSSETPTSRFGKVVFISNEEVESICCGRIGAQSRFCIEKKLDGEEGRTLLC